MQGSERDRDTYDGALRQFVSEKEDGSRSQAQVWQNNLLAVSLAFVVFLTGANVAGPDFRNLTNKILGYPSTGVGFGCFMWAVFGIALSIAAYSMARMLFYGDLADSLSSGFKPSEADLVRAERLDGGASRFRATDLRRRFYGSYQDLLAKRMLHYEHEERQKHPVRRFVKRLFHPIPAMKQISIRVHVEPDSKLYRYRAQRWLTGIRAVFVGFFWASCAAAFVGLRIRSPGWLVFVLAGVAFLVLHLLQFAWSWRATGRLAENLQKEERRRSLRVPDAFVVKRTGDNSKIGSASGTEH